VKRKSFPFGIVAALIAVGFTGLVGVAVLYVQDVNKERPTRNHATPLSGAQSFKRTIESYLAERERAYTVTRCYPAEPATQVVYMAVRSGGIEIWREIGTINEIPRGTDLKRVVVVRVQYETDEGFGRKACHDDSFVLSLDGEVYTVLPSIDTRVGRPGVYR
jgi:hypothetical protein